MKRKPKPKIEGADPLRFEGNFHKNLWKLLGPLTQSTLAERISDEGLVQQSKDTIRGHWHSRYWDAEIHNRVIVDDAYACPQIYPHLSHIAKVLAKGKETHEKEALAFIRYRFLKESYNLGLYRPFAEGHRFSQLLNWVYMPDSSHDERKIYERITFILAFNGDFQIYRHLCVLVDRVLTNPVHLTYLADILPKLAVLMSLFADYQLSIDTCSQASELIANHPVLHKNATVLKYELQCIQADALSHIPFNDDFKAVAGIKDFITSIQGCAKKPKESGLNADDIDHLLRMGYTCYFRGIVRIMLHLRASGVSYRLPSDLEVDINDFEKRANAYREALMNDDRKDARASYKKLHEGEHYAGLEQDSLSRAFAWIKTELAIRKAKEQLAKQKSKPKDENEWIRKHSAAGVAEALEKAKRYLEEADRLFSFGDENDAKAIVEIDLDRTLLPVGVRADNLSSYRINSTHALYEIQAALASDDADLFQKHVQQAVNYRHNFERQVGVHNLHHARILNERIKTMTDQIRFDSRAKWYSLLVL